MFPESSTSHSKDRESYTPPRERAKKPPTFSPVEYDNSNDAPARGDKREVSPEYPSSHNTKFIKEPTQAPRSDIRTESEAQTTASPVYKRVKRYSTNADLDFHPNTNGTPTQSVTVTFREKSTDRKPTSAYETLKSSSMQNFCSSSVSSPETSQKSYSERKSWPQDKTIPTSPTQIAQRGTAESQITQSFDTRDPRTARRRVSIREPAAVSSSIEFPPKSQKAPSPISKPSISTYPVSQPLTSLFRKPSVVSPPLEHPPKSKLIPDSSSSSTAQLLQQVPQPTKSSHRKDPRSTKPSRRVPQEDSQTITSQEKASESASTSCAHDDRRW